MRALTRPKTSATTSRPKKPPSISTEGTRAAVMAMAAAMTSHTMISCLNIHPA